MKSWSRSLRPLFVVSRTFCGQMALLDEHRSTPCHLCTQTNARSYNRRVEVTDTVLPGFGASMCNFTIAARFVEGTAIASQTTYITGALQVQHL